ncbi:hypothetical protein RhiirC2_737053 [Rhizophagus irregularis]|uniref:Uncharacterized protein n=1 Tax=Rhizophagus irregularis TaxID=588596 RepID=A0A2N1NMW2_9GLOM|nr:hypothetical protein RhiirC2_737053 [Rhizophagus irregularis]
MQFLVTYEMQVLILQFVIVEPMVHFLVEILSYVLLMNLQIMIQVTVESCIMKK